MTTVRTAAALVGVLFVLTALGRADDNDTIKALLDKGIKAMGGEDKIAKYPGLMVKGGGKFYEGDKPVPYTGTWYTQGLDKSRTTTAVDFGKGVKSVEVTVLNGTKGWVKSTGEDTRDLDKDGFADERDNLYLNYVTSVLPLKGKDFKLTLLPEIKVNNKAAPGILVAQKGRRDIKLYFDKDTGLLVRAERKVRDPDTKKDVTEEVLYSDYKDVDGIKIAMKYATKWDGKNRADAEMTEAKVFEKVDEKLFEKP